MNVLINPPVRVQPQPLQVQWRAAANQPYVRRIAAGEPAIGLRGVSHGVTVRGP